jgi:hypothetical protein
MLRAVPEMAEVILGETPLGLGIAAAAVVAILGARTAKPLVKRGIVGYLAVAGGARGMISRTGERARELVAEAGEQMQDLYAEAKHEYEAERATAQADRAASAARPA